MKKIRKWLKPSGSNEGSKADIKVLERGEAIRAPPPNPIIAIPDANPGRREERREVMVGGGVLLT